jgi:hypothetical protein
MTIHPTMSRSPARARLIVISAQSHPTGTLAWCEPFVTARARAWSAETMSCGS